MHRAERSRDASKFSWLTFPVVVLFVGVVSLMEAYAGLSASQRRQRSAGLVAEVFERFFFTEWLGEPLSLRGSGACPESQLLAAVRGKAQFPRSFLRGEPDTRSGAKHCAAATRRAVDKKWLNFAVTIPNVGDCNAYARRWRTLTTASDIKEPLRAYSVSDRAYDKYEIEPQSRTVYQAEGNQQDRLTAVAAVRLVGQSEAKGLCRFEFEQSETKYERDLKEIKGWFGR